MNAFFESLTGLRFVDPWMLALALLLPLGLWLGRRAKGAALPFAPLALLEGESLPESPRQRLLPLPPALQLLALLCFVLALARPGRRVELPRERAGIDIFLCLDVSSSMAAKDMDPERTRLELARDAAARFIAGRPDDRIGLIRFARYPDLLCPLTLDHHALLGFLGELEQVDPDGQEDLTGIGTAVARAAQVLRGSVARSKVVILLTDGEETVATADTPEEIGPLRAALLSRKLGVRVYSIAAGIGKQSRSGGFVPLDKRPMQELAARTGGEFFEARDAGAVAGVYARIGELEKVEFEEPRFEVEERFLPFLIAGILLMLCRLLLQQRLLEALP